jgi:hypothetical protein
MVRKCKAELASLPKDLRPVLHHYQISMPTSTIFVLIWDDAGMCCTYMILKWYVLGLDERFGVANYGQYSGQAGIFTSPSAFAFDHYDGRAINTHNLPGVVWATYEDLKTWICDLLGMHDFFHS